MALDLIASLFSYLLRRADEQKRIIDFHHLGDQEAQSAEEAGTPQTPKGGILSMNLYRWSRGPVKKVGFSSSLP